MCSTNRSHDLPANQPKYAVNDQLFDRFLLFVFSSALLILGLAVTPDPARAQSCQSATQVASDLWSEYGDIAQQVGCAGVTAGTVVASGGTSLPQAVSQYKACVGKADEAAAVADGMVQAWNRLARNSWATFGPRRLALNQDHEGTIRSSGTRMFVTESPITAATLNLSVEKLRFRGKTDVTVCTFLPDGTEDRVWNFQMAPGLGNKGNTWTRELNDVAGRIVSVFFNGRSAAKSMKYRLRAEPGASLEYRESAEGANGWSQGYTTAKFFETGGGTYLFTLKASSGEMYINEMDPDGTVGAQVLHEDWSSGWTTVEFFEVNNQTYLFLLKESDGEVYVNAMNDDGTVGPEVVHDDWTQGYTTASFFEVANQMYLLTLKASNGEVYINEINDDGTIGEEIRRGS